MVDPDAGLSSAPWPPQFPATLVEGVRERLDDCSVLVIVGPSGGGRNQLASAVADLPAGPVWSRHVSRFGEIEIPYFGLRQLFPALRPSIQEGVDAVERATLAHALDLGANLPPIVLAGADLCDPESVEILVRLATDGHLRLIATLPPESVADRRRLVDAAAVVELQPVTHGEATQMLQSRFGLVPQPELVDLLIEQSDALHARLCDIADTAVTTGAFAAVEGRLVIDADGGPAARAPLAGDPPELTDLLHLTAVLGVIEIDEARALFPPEVVDLLISRGDLQAIDDGLHFASPVEGVLVLRGLSHLRQVELFDRFSALLPRTLVRPGVAVRAGDWWRASGSLLPIDLAHRAAREANLTGRYRRAVVFTDPDHVVGHGAVALIERIYALVEVGDYATLRELYAGLDPASLTEDELLPYLRWLHRLRDDEDRTSLGERAVTAVDPAVARRRAAVRTLSDLIERAFVEAGQTLISQLRALCFTSHLSPPNRAIAFTTLAAVLRHSARPVESVEAAEFAVTLLEAESETVSAFHLDVAREYHVLALLSALELDRATRALHAYSWGPFGHPGSGRLTTAMHALVDLHRGDTAQALTHLRLCLAGIRGHDPRNVRAWIQAVLAATLALSDRPQEAAVMLEASAASRTGRAQWDLERQVAHAFVLDRLAQPEEALDQLEDVMTEARERGLLLVEIDAAVLSVVVGGPPHLADLLAVVDHLVDLNGTAAVWQAFARAARDRDLDNLIQLADQLDERRAHLLAATVAQYVLDVARRADDLDAPTRSRMEQLSDRGTAVDAD